MGNEPDGRLVAIARQFDLMTRAEAKEVTWAQLLAAIGGRQVGRSLCTWWSKYADCYRDATSWIKLRHRSYTAIDGLATALGSAETFAAAIDSLKDAALGARAVANEIALEVKRYTRWCSPFGQQLLLSHRAGQGQLAMDPLELASAMWLADRLSEPWPEPLEDLAMATIADTQRADGGFPGVTPLYERSGFTHFAPSATTIGVLARFTARGGITPVTPLARRRLRRWATVLSRGAEYLLQSAVLHDGKPVGWHSDRHPAWDRIDSLTTTEAVKALCRIDDSLRRLINLEAYGDFAVTWPEFAPRRPIPTDLGCGPRQLLLTAGKVAESLRRRTSGYGAAAQRRVGDPAKHSLLFYGPPGTGKTSLQEWVAAELDWPLVMITIGDFLREGEGQVGKKAVEIFHRLGFVSKTCIVFEEFDEMVAERAPTADHPGAPKGPALLTPAMLPLLSELRKRAEAKCCLVSFTTNYIASIDYAARRVGRVDREILLMYPDCESRLLLAIHEAPGEWAWKDIESLAESTGLCTLGAVLDCIAQPAGIGTAPKPRPAPAIPRDYYRESLGGNLLLSQEVVALVRAIGPGEDRARFLASPTGRPWASLFHKANSGLALPPDDGKLARLTFRLASLPKRPSEGEEVVCISGNVPILGSWNPRSALRLRPNPDRTVWELAIDLPTDVELEFKFFIRPILEGFDWEPYWEQASNRRYKVPTTPDPYYSSGWQEQR